ncbi:cation-translocating P-type ATPase [Acrocarpospora sp. B8E8]|uniref:cation-translocating P-type ATPase n=1 Tax=Acrocarpospora sp. B8E8 TaxID=3153572 RepID=UPI00325CBC1F
MRTNATLVAGLTWAEAEHRRATCGPNFVPIRRGRHLWDRLFTQLRDPMIVLLLAAGAIALAMRDVVDALVIGLVIVVNTTIGVLQELRAARAVDALADLAAPTARVRRDGVDRVIPAAEVVPGDLMILTAGDVVAADAELAEAVQLQLDEAALTGESVPVDKTVTQGPDERRVWAGTVVTHGRGAAVVTAIGADSSLGRIAASLAGQRPRPTPLQTRLARLGRLLALSVLAASALVFVLGVLRGEPVLEMLLVGVSLAVAVVPESLPAVVTLALALGARRMAQRSAVVRRLPAVETLGSVSVLAVDKTGTLTEGRMVATRVWTASGAEYEVTGSGYAPVGEIRPDPDDLTPLLRAAVLCNDAHLVPPGRDGEWSAAGDPLEAALLALAGKAGMDPAACQREYPRVSEVPFDSSRKRMTTVHRTPAGGWLVACKGAPDVIGDSAAALAKAAELAASGYRVIAVAENMSDMPPAMEGELRLLGLVAITDPPRADAAGAVAACMRAGIQFRLITGDHPAAARAVAERVGIPAAAAQVVTGPELAEGVSAERLAEARVFARTLPEQKLDIVQALQRDGHVVAMTGDGVNDGPALRRADIGVAMGRGGTEVARQAADLVLTDDNLRTVVSAVEEGRRIYANIRRFLRYGLSGGLAELLVMLVMPFFGPAVALQPAQILWINMLTHGLPGVAMGAEPADPEAMGRPPRPLRQSILGGLLAPIAGTGAAIAAIAVGLGAWAWATGRPWQTMIFITLGLAQLGVALAVRAPVPAEHRRRNRFLDLAVLTALIFQVAPMYLEPLRQLLRVEPLGAGELLLACGLAVIPGLVLAATRRRSR